MTIDKNTNEKGIVTATYGKNTYTFWHIADVVYPYISEFLDKQFPNSIRIREFNYTDYVILKENLPVEVQATVLSVRTGSLNPGGLNHSEFEQKIEKQLKQDIDRYNRCLFFLDSEYLRYLQDNVTKNTRINLDWFYQFIKDGKLRVFIVRHDGIINEVFLKDFDFILNISTIGRKDNRFKIMSNVLEGYKFTNKEIDTMYNMFKLTEHKYKSFYKWLTRTGHSDREFEYMYILGAVTHLDSINDMLACRLDKNSDIKTIARDAQKLGLIKTRDTGKVGFMRIFTDEFNIAPYLEGYLTNKDLWDDLRTRYISFDTLCAITTGKVDINWWKKQKSIDDAWK